MRFINTIFLTLILVFKINDAYTESQFNVHCILEKIPNEDKEKLDTFFKNLIINNAFGYTLFGKKPFVLETFSTSASLDKSNSNYLLFEGWKAWEKYRHLFPRKYFSLDCIENFNSFNERQQTLILFNIEQLKKHYKTRYSSITLKKKNCITEDLFKKNPFSFTNEKDIFLFVKQEKPSKLLRKIYCFLKISETTPKEHLMLGILLGYGKSNAVRFARFTEVFNALIELPYFPQNIPKEFDYLNDFTKENLFYTKEHRLQKPSFENDSNRNLKIVSEMIKENNFLTEQWQSLSQIYPDGPMTLVHLPVFIADKNLSETKKLYRRYNRVRNHITTLLQQSNFLEIVLTKYCEG